MSKLLVKKDTYLVNASYNLSLVEQRLLLLAIASCDGKADAMTAVSVHASAYAEIYGITIQAAYMALSEAAAHLFERKFSFTRETKKGTKITVSRWVSVVSYIEEQARVELCFSPTVIPFLSELQRRFTWYPLEEVADLSSTYAIRIYELLIAWRSTGQTPVFSLSDFREKLGINEEEYPRMDNFKRFVLDSSIKQINEKTEIVAEYQQHKTGRTITGLSFTFAPKKKAIAAEKGKKASTGKHLTLREAEKLARNGETYPQLFARLKAEGYTVERV